MKLDKKFKVSQFDANEKKFKFVKELTQKDAGIALKKSMAKVLKATDAEKAIPVFIYTKYTFDCGGLGPIVFFGQPDGKTKKALKPFVKAFKKDSIYGRGFVTQEDGNPVLNIMKQAGSLTETKGIKELKKIKNALKGLYEFKILEVSAEVTGDEDGDGVMDEGATIDHNAVLMELIGKYKTLFPTVKMILPKLKKLREKGLPEKLQAILDAMNKIIDRFVQSFDKAEDEVQQKFAKIKATMLKIKGHLAGDIGGKGDENKTHKLMSKLHKKLQKALKKVNLEALLNS